MTAKRKSEEAGVSVAYLLSDEFLSLARKRSGKANPSFRDLKEAFWMADQPIGEGQICPRSGKMGCALVDWLPEEYVGGQTHFLSWSWGYTVEEVRSALRLWLTKTGLAAEEVFLFMCFFVNNQFRILKEKSSTGSDDLVKVFGPTLERIGIVVALLDSWNSPQYLTRIWTIFEQFTAIQRRIPVHIIMPEAATRGLMLTIERGSVGLTKVCDSLCKVNSESAEAWEPKDKEKVKDMIRNTEGSFMGVNAQIRKFMLNWVSEVVKNKMADTIEQRLPQSGLAPPTGRTSGRCPSEEAGVSAAYLLSDEFLSIARERSGLENPSWNELVQAFFFSGGRSGGLQIGLDRRCPRDGQMGCAMIDVLSEEYVGSVGSKTHYLSCSLNFRVEDVRSALRFWLTQTGLVATEVFLDVYFFVTNFFRLISGQKTEHLRDLCRRTFRHGSIKGLLVLDNSWSTPTCIQRAWMTWEMWNATELDVPVHIIMPETAREDLIETVQRSRAGLTEVRLTIMAFDTELALASNPDDLNIVMADIRNSETPYKTLNAKVQTYFFNWVTSVVNSYFDPVAPA